MPKKTKALFNLPLVEEGIRKLLVGLGEDPTRDGLKETPKRVAKFYQEVLNGYHEDPESYLKVFDVPAKNMVIVKDIPFYSFCEHHMCPFIGKMHIGYIPKKKVIGLSKLVRLSRVYAKRLQVQERLTDQIADCLAKHLQPLGVMVYIEAEHTCMTLRGVRTPGAKTITSAVRGVFKDPRRGARVEFMEAIAR